MRFLLVVGGGIAAFKCCELARELGRRGHTVRVVMTPAATRFVTPLSFEALTGEPAFVDLWESREGPMEHIDLARWADRVVVAPATADLLARMALGLGNDLATTVLLANDRPTWVAPAMNPAMWAHPATEENVRTLEARGVHRVGPAAGDTACGEVGAGRMAEPGEIADAVTGAGDGPLAGVRVLITAGPTREHLDPARFLSNPSTGRMGFEVARAARAAGASVVLVLGPTSLAAPPVDERVDVVSAAEMAEAVAARRAEADVLVASAAVADWTPAAPEEQKQAKVEGPMSLELVRTEDILASCVAARREGQLIVGFAAESHDVLARGRAKLERKGVDLLVANQIGAPGTGFGGTGNRAAILVAGEPDPPELREVSKADLARELVAAVVARKACL
jgi:phosphopantothenoylcysteine decarboxylase/phosphopantothenate--cysteine ligase